MTNYTEDNTKKNISGNTVADNTNTLKPEGEVPPAQLYLTVSNDRTAAFLNTLVTDSRQTVTEEQILDTLKNKGIVYGIKFEEIKKFCEDKKFFQELICAEGKDPINQEDGEIEFNFQRVIKLRPQDREDGTVDYHDLGLVQQVKAGDVLCQVIQGKPGTDGIDVYGNPIKYRKGAVPKLPAGRNTVVSDDGLQLMAKIDGLIAYKGGIVNIDDVCTINGDVNNSTGNINFAGSVVINGDVRTGFKINSGKDVIVKGVVEGSQITAKGDIKVSAGVIGMNTAVLISGGNITAKYFESTTVKCSGSVYADFYVSSNISAGENICAEGAKASILGGSYTAGKVICAGLIGSDTGFFTNVSIISEDLKNLLNNKAEDKYKALLEQKEEKNDLLSKINIKIKSIKPSNHRDVDLYSNLLLAKKQVADEVKKLDAEINACIPKKNFIKYRIVAKKYMYRGVKMTIGPFVERVAVDESHMTYYVNEEGLSRIVATQADYIERR